jgi:hypothetical protein
MMENNSSKYVPLSDQARAVILGSILGDGSLKKQSKYANANLQIRHSETQKEYLLWKAEMLKEVASEKSVSVQKPDGYSKNLRWRFCSRSVPSLTEVHNHTCKKNKLRIQRKWLNEMMPLSLAVWWCDDGSLIGHGSRRGVFCTDGFDESAVKTLSRYMKVMWNVQTVVAPVNDKREGRQPVKWRLWIRSQEEVKKFLRIVLPHIHVRSMLHKTILLYKDSQLQQRWISEVVSLSTFSRKVVMEEYEKKCARHKYFR